MNESLMWLLLKLDSNPTVRETRRKVSRRIVDAIVSEDVDGFWGGRDDGFGRNWDDVLAEMKEETSMNKITQRSKDLTDNIFEFPGQKSPLKAIHMIELVLNQDDPVYWDFLSFCSYLPKSKGIIVNTFEELEPPAILQAIAEGLCKFHALGDVGEGCEFHGVGRSTAFAEAEVSSAARFGKEAVGEQPVVFQGGLLNEGDFFQVETEQTDAPPPPKSP
ncbi:hypothetical protein ACFXTN_022210 [Malus domestica]